MEEINYEPLLPKEPLADIVSFARQNGKFKEQYLIYKADREYVPLEDRMRPAVLVSCSGCGKSFYAEKVSAGGCHPEYAPAPFGWWNQQRSESVISGNHTMCPLCGTEAKTVHVGSIRTYGGELVDDAWVSELTRLPVEGHRDRLALLDWCIRRCIDKQGSARYEIWPFTAWVVEERKIVRLMGYQKNIGGAITLFGEWRQRKTFADTYGSTNLLIPWDKSLLEGTTAENSKLDLYIGEKGRRLVSYLALWRKRPAVENLLVQGCGAIVREWINGETGSGYYRGGIPKLERVNWKEKRPARMLGLNQGELRQLRRGQWSANDLEVYRLVRDSGVPVSLPEDMELLRAVQNYECNRILTEMPKADFWRVLRYLKKQKESWNSLRDYWRMAGEDGRDLTDSLVRWPRDLTAAHRRQIEERQAARDREQAKQRAEEKAQRKALFSQRAEELAPLAFTMGGLLIRPCASEDELNAEGRQLHHCVASYAQSHAAGSTAIFFIRRVERPEEPYFTLEFDEKAYHVRQNRGLRNCDRTPEVTAFEKAWLAWLKGKGVKTA